MWLKFFWINVHFLILKPLQNPNIKIHNAGGTYNWIDHSSESGCIVLREGGATASPRPGCVSGARARAERPFRPTPSPFSFGNEWDRHRRNDAADARRNGLN